MNVVDFAKELARAHQRAKLPCPVCVSSVKAENLEKHIEKVHTDHAYVPATTWRGKTLMGLIPCKLVLDGNALVLSRFGLKRRVPLDGAIEIGPIYGSRPEAGMSSYAGDMNVPYEAVRTGSYLRIVGTSSITIGCRQGTQFAEHWNRGMWKLGGRRSSCDIRVERTTLAAVEYALARAGRLVPSAAGSRAKTGE